MKDVSSTFLQFPVEIESVKMGIDNKLLIFALNRFHLALNVKKWLLDNLYSTNARPIHSTVYKRKLLLQSNSSWS